MHDDALLHISRVDPALARVIQRVGDCRFAARSDGTHFAHIARAIIYQQLSGKAAATIHRRFEEIYGGRAPTPAELLATPDEQLRAAGVSRQKAAYLKDLAAKVASGEVPLERIESLDDDAIIRALVAVKGVGRWTAQMFLMFRLGRADVLPELDLGVQRGIQIAYGLDALPKPRELQLIGAKWAPYRSIASWYLWRSLEDPETAAAAARAAKAASKQAPAARRSARSAVKRMAKRMAKRAAKRTAKRTATSTGKRRAKTPAEKAGRKRAARAATTRSAKGAKGAKGAKKAGGPPPTSKIRPKRSRSATGSSRRGAK